MCRDCWDSIISKILRRGSVDLSPAARNSLLDNVIDLLPAWCGNIDNGSDVVTTTPVKIQLRCSPLQANFCIGNRPLATAISYNAGFSNTLSSNNRFQIVVFKQ
jgi:hypothetical protein